MSSPIPGGPPAEPVGPPTHMTPGDYRGRIATASKSFRKMTTVRYIMTGNPMLVAKQDSLRNSLFIFSPIIGNFSYIYVNNSVEPLTLTPPMGIGIYTGSTPGMPWLFFPLNGEIVCEAWYAVGFAGDKLDVFEQQFLD